MDPSVWLIGGATASGKSALALRLAEASGAWVVNADSMQIYRGLEILSAAPRAAERARAAHRLYGVAEPSEHWSVGRWLKAAEGVLAERRGAPVIFVGGTGLYFRALTAGLAPTPQISPAVALKVRALAAEGGEGALRAALANGDPPSGAAVAPGDLQRLTRALEVLLETGRPIESWRGGTRPLLPEGRYRGVVLEVEREELYRRCDARFAAMMEEGGVEEVEALLGRGLSPELPAMKALGVREIGRYLSGDATREAALAEARQATRRYAKRQMTWFRHQTPAWLRVSGPDPDLLLRSA